MDFLLLLLILPHLRFTPVSPFSGIEVVVAFVDIQARLFNLKDSVHGLIEEVSVMGNDDHRSSVPLEVLFQPLQCSDIQMVRRFVQKQDVRLLQKQNRQCKSRLLTARQCRNLLIVHGLVKGHAGENASDLTLIHVAAHALIALTELLVAGQFFLRKQPLHLLLHLREVLKYFVHFLDHCPVGVESAVLFQITGSEL